MKTICSSVLGAYAFYFYSVDRTRFWITVGALCGVAILEILADYFVDEIWTIRQWIKERALKK